eukprot:s432_g27.t1
MSLSVFLRLVKKHAPFVKKGTKPSDNCDHCHCLQTVVLPRMNSLRSVFFGCLQKPRLIPVAPEKCFFDLTEAHARDHDWPSPESILHAESTLRSQRSRHSGVRRPLMSAGMSSSWRTSQEMERRLAPMSCSFSCCLRQSQAWAA